MFLLALLLVAIASATSPPQSDNVDTMTAIHMKTSRCPNKCSSKKRKVRRACRRSEKRKQQCRLVKCKKSNGKKGFSCVPRKKKVVPTDKPTTPEPTPENM